MKNCLLLAFFSFLKAAIGHEGKCAGLVPFYPEVNDLSVGLKHFPEFFICGLYEY